MNLQNNEKVCVWRRIGEPWPNNRDNYWLTGCGCADHGKLALGLCPHCAKPVEGSPLIDEYLENMGSTRARA